MSNEMQERVQNALAESLPDAMVTNFFLVAESLDDKGDHNWLYLTSADQTWQESMGLVQWADGILRYEQQRYLEEQEE